MDALQNYTAGSDSEEDGEITATSSQAPQFPVMNLAPPVAFTPKLNSSTVAIYDERSREMKTNAKYEDLFKPDVGFIFELSEDFLRSI